jgi:hypothetical protein
MERKRRLTLDEAVLSEAQALVRQKLKETCLLKYKIGDTWWQEDHFGKKKGYPKPCAKGWESSITVTSEDPNVKIRNLSPWSVSIRFPDRGLKKICKRCKKEFFTGARRSRVICQECKVEIKNRPDRYEKICPICHKSFQSKRSDAHTCNKESCRKALYRQKKRSKSSPLSITP